MKFINDYPNYDIDVKLCAFSSAEMIKAQNEFNNWASEKKSDFKT